MYLPHGSTTVKATRLRHATGARCCRTRPLAARDDQQKEKKVTCDTVSALSLARRRLPFYSEIAPCVRSCARPAQQKPQAGSWRPATPRRKRRAAGMHLRMRRAVARAASVAALALAVPAPSLLARATLMLGSVALLSLPARVSRRGRGRCVATCTTAHCWLPARSAAQLLRRAGDAAIHRAAAVLCPGHRVCVCSRRAWLLPSLCMLSALTSADGARSVARVCCCAGTLREAKGGGGSTGLLWAPLG